MAKKLPTFKEYHDKNPEKTNRDPYWRDYLYAKDSGQVSHKAAIGHKRERAVKNGEMKFVPSYTKEWGNVWKTDTPEERTANIRKNAATRQNGYGTEIPKAVSMKQTKKAYSVPNDRGTIKKRASNTEGANEYGKKMAREADERWNRDNAKRVLEEAFKKNKKSAFRR